MVGARVQAEPPETAGVTVGYWHVNAIDVGKALPALHSGALTGHTADEAWTQLIGPLGVHEAGNTVIVVQGEVPMFVTVLEL